MPSIRQLRLLARRRRKSRYETLEARDYLSASVTSFHYDQSSSGLNPNETLLAPANVNPTNFGKLATTPLDGQVYAQPLYVPGVPISTGPNQGVHDVVFAATEHDSVYAIDADSGVALWHANFLNPADGVTTVPPADVDSTDIAPEYGITGTPVIDPSTDSLYVVAYTKEVRADGPHYVYRLHALDLSNGAEKFGGPLLIADTLVGGPVTGNHAGAGLSYTFVAGPSVNGIGNGSVGGRVTFNALWQLQRPGLALADGNVYIAFGSHGSLASAHGWVLSVNAQTMTINGVLNTTPNGSLGTIWQSGNAITVDSAGDLFVSTGNGDFGANLNAQGFPADGNYGDSVLKIAPDPSSTPAAPNQNGWGLKIVDYFTPHNQSTLGFNNIDLGSGGLILLPSQYGSAAHPNLLLTGGKQGVLYLIDRDDMGKYNPTTDRVVQVITGLISRSNATPAEINNDLYLGGVGDPLVSTEINDGVISVAPWSVADDALDYPGATPAISSDGPYQGIVWIVDKGRNELRAYNAGDLTDELYNSGMAGARDALGTSVKFTVPTVADGHVYVGTAGGLAIYGMLASAEAPGIAGAGTILNAAPQAALTNVTAAIFSSGDGSAPASAFSAAIDWGDGATTPGTVSAVGGAYFVSGSHVYQSAGDFALVVHVTGNGGAVSLPGQAIIRHDDIPGAGSLPNQIYVAQAYRAILGRDADPAGLADWSAKLDAGLSPYAFAYSLTHSTEYYANLVTATYSHYLGRQPDAAGLFYWVSQMQAGLSDESLEAKFIASQEYFAASGGTNSAWVDHMYEDLLGRPADPQGAANWVAFLARGASRSTIAYGFAASAEREGRRVQDDYAKYLGRSASAEGINGWINAFLFGVSNEDVVAGFVGSAEYYRSHSS